MHNISGHSDPSNLLCAVPLCKCRLPLHYLQAECKLGSLQVLVYLCVPSCNNLQRRHVLLLRQGSHSPCCVAAVLLVWDGLDNLTAALMIRPCRLQVCALFQPTTASKQCLGVSAH